MTAVRTPDAPRPRGWYSQAIVAGGFVFTAGLGPVDPTSRAIVGAEAGEQTRQVLRNLAAVLRAAGCGLGDVVKMTAHLADVDRDWDAFDAACREFFPDPPPARTTVGSQLGDILVEIDVVAVLPT
jgi:reactive intermediate/imine deaminase